MGSALPLVVLLCLVVGQLDGWRLRACRTRLIRPVWTRFGSRFFIIQPRSMTMADAELNCIRRGGNLASIHSNREHNWIRGQIRRVLRSNRAAWIGLFDAVQERKWMWTDGSRVRFTRWFRREPNNQHGREDCTQINFGGNLWNDKPCNTKLPSVCVKRR